MTGREVGVEVEVVEGELVPDGGERLPELAPQTAPVRALVDRHTVLAPGQPVPTTADAPTYTEADLRISERTARRLEEESAPANTSATYRSQRQAFAAWCEAQGRVAKPCTTATFIEYVSHLIERDAAPSTVSVAMSAIRTWMPDDARPGTKQTRGMLNEYAKAWAKRKRKKKAPAIRESALRAMLGTCNTRHPKDVRDAAVLTLGWGALNRRIELADLTVADVTVEDEGVTLYIATSKTDQAARGAETFIPARPEDPVMDPVRRTRAWLETLHAVGGRDGPVFRALTVAGTLQNRDRATRRGLHVTGDAINDWVRNRAHRAGLPNWRQVTAHGLRRGGAQEISEGGGDPTEQGRWTPGSAVVKREYLDRARSREQNPWRAIMEARKAGGGL